jgi:hypothetical protein
MSNLSSNSTLAGGVISWPGRRVGYRVDPNTGCWLWQGAVNTKGYGLVKIDGKTLRSHRAYFTTYVGPIPAGYHLHHTCERPSCVNPDHLEPLPPRQHDLMRAKLSEADVIVIRASRGTQKALAQTFGVSPSMIGHIRRGYRWKSVVGQA